MFRTLFSIALIAAVLASCATYKRHYARDAKQWDQESQAGDLRLLHTMYLVGDAGDATPEDMPRVLTYLKTVLPKESSKSSIIFLGDNIYEYGMPPKEDSVNRKIGEFRITAQLAILDEFKGRPVFVPGNHDWRGWGQKGLKSQEKFVEDYINTKRGIDDKDDWENYLLPDDGCAGPEAIELNDGIVIIVVDSQWWLQDSDEEPKINDGCAVRNKASFRFQFENMIRKYKNQQVVIAMHHPPYTYGPHGGGFAFKDHVFPLTELNPNLYVPLPGLGSIAAIFRASIGSKQDVAHQDYKELRSALMAGTKKNGSFIFAAGHEHALQYIENEGQHFIVSGSGSKKSPVMLGRGSKFASGAMGYSTVSFYEGGESWVSFYEVNSEGTAAELVYKKRVREGHRGDAETIPTSFPEYDQHKESVSHSVVNNRVDAVGGFHNFMLGEHYRNLYLQQYQFPVLDLSTYRGGVVPIKQGGGNQTNSLRVRDSEGHDYSLRGMTKDVSRFLPYPFNKMVAAKYVVEDNFLSTHPFAPLAVPHLADAIDVYHTNPKLYYIPPQPALGAFNVTFGGGVHLVEERPAGKHWKNAPWFGSPDKIVSTPDLTENLLKNNKYKVDQQWALRTRMLDFLIGDWDRHDDQWTWASFEVSDDSILYRPIPRDRDQAFSRYDGVISSVARQTMPFLRQLQVYGPDIRSMKWTTWSARLFDRSFLTELEWKEWEAEVKRIQERLTDAVIDSAFRDWPANPELREQQIAAAVKARRDHLMQIARTHYEFLSSSVDVVGTDDPERFVIERIDGQTRVTGYELSKKGKQKRVTYQRTFDNAVTNSIQIYGNGDDDDFVVRGRSKDGIKLRLIGGLGKDKFYDSSRVARGGKKTLIYDDLRKNSVFGGAETKDMRSSLSRYNIYDRRGYDSEYDITIPFPIVGYNPDDQFLIGAQFDMIKHTFKKVPYASHQRFGGSFAFGTKAVKVNYQADFLDVFRSVDVFIDARYHGPSYAFNFAGMGNETKRPVDDPNYYRVRQEGLFLLPALKKRFAGISGYFTVGPTFLFAHTENTNGRFIHEYGEDGNEHIFDRLYYAGARVGFHYNNVDNFFSPHSGIRLNSTFDWMENLKNEKGFTTWRNTLSLYKALDRRENLILATQFGYGQNFGTGYEFWQMPSIGGSMGLRGYRTERFYGDIMFWQSTDLRVRIASSRNPIVPFTVGLYGGFDYGRVWLKGENSDTWHNSYGGGLWFMPVDALVFSFGLFMPKEEDEESPRFVFKLGFNF
ncbi:metallophosphoesterase [Chryseolinea sp. T2]|uniref:metallophosphoesterase n=1 Tax=Chryseolinea sp. T2 TaxID=3129255 RepID=UPI0030776D61